MMAWDTSPQGLAGPLMSKYITIISKSATGKGRRGEGEGGGGEGEESGGEGEERGGEGEGGGGEERGGGGEGEERGGEKKYVLMLDSVRTQYYRLRLQNKWHLLETSMSSSSGSQ